MFLFGQKAQTWHKDAKLRYVHHFPRLLGSQLQGQFPILLILDDAGRRGLLRHIKPIQVLDQTLKLANKNLSKTGPFDPCSEPRATTGFSGLGFSTGWGLSLDMSTFPLDGSLGAPTWLHLSARDSTTRPATSASCSKNCSETHHKYHQISSNIHTPQLHASRNHLF